MLNIAEIMTLVHEIVKSWDWTAETEQPEPNRLDVRITTLKELLPIVTALRVKRLGYLSAITGIDHGVDAGKLEVLYHFCTGEVVITLRVYLPRESASVPSLCAIIPGAEPFERELSEMFGVTFVGNPNPIRLYLPDEWPQDVYPLRKDFDEQAITFLAKKGGHSANERTN